MLNIILYRPEIPPNTGNIARLCTGVGATLHLVRPLGFQIDDKAVRRAGLDYWPHLKLEVHEDWSTFEGLYGPSTRDGFYFFSARSKKPYWQVRFPVETWLVFGPESTGLPHEMLERHADRALHIPMKSPHVRSLNLSNAAAVAVYEYQRQRAIAE